jgi:hypothetical protein
VTHVALLLVVSVVLYLLFRPRRRKAEGGQPVPGAAPTVPGVAPTVPGVAPTVPGVAPAAPADDRVRPSVSSAPRPSAPPGAGKHHVLFGLEKLMAGRGEPVQAEPALVVGPLPSVVAGERLRKERARLQAALKGAAPSSVEDAIAQARRLLCAEWLDRARARVPLASLKIPGVGANLIAAIEAAGFHSLYDIENRRGWERIPGIGDAREQAIRAAAWSFRSEGERAFAALSDSEVDQAMEGRLGKAIDDAEAGIVKFERDRMAAELNLEAVSARLAALAHSGSQ